MSPRYVTPDDTIDKVAAWMIKDGGFPSRYASAVWDEVDAATRELVRQFLLNDWYTSDGRRRGLFVGGGTGVGKSSLLHIIARTLAESFIVYPRFVSLGRLFDMYFERQFDAVAELERCVVLCIDDFGRRYSAEYPLARFETFFEYRYANNLPTFISSDVSIADFAENPQMQRIIDRINDPRWMMHLVYAGTTKRTR